MNFRPYIMEAIAAFPKVVTPEIVSRACTSLDISPGDFCDHFAKDAVRAYLDGELSWSDSDAAMNALSGFFFAHLTKEASFPDYAFGVFLAFDAGEVCGEPENGRITKERLSSLHPKA